MSMGYRGKLTNSQREITAVQIQSERESIWGELTGTIVSFNPSKQSAVIQPDYKPNHNGQYINMPLLHDVPVRFQRIGGFIITIPVNVGDKVTLRPQMRSSEEFHTGGDAASINDSRSMSLSDMEAFIDGGEPLTKPIDNFNSENLEIRNESGSFKIEMTENGKFRMKGVNGDFLDLVTRVVEALADDGLEIKFGSSKAKGLHSLEKADEYSDIASKLRGMVI